MYLLVFVTLVISLMSVYAQVVVIQANRIAAQQKGVAQHMLEWHRAAVSMAASLIDTNTTNGLGTDSYTSIGPTSGCSLGYVLPPTGVITKRCPGPIDPKTVTPVNGSTNGTGTLTNAANALNLICIYTTKFNGLPSPAHCDGADPNVGGSSGSVHLSADYNLASYQFYSILYQTAGGANYVVTFVPAGTVSAANPSGFITMASGNQIGFTTADLMQQLQHSGVPQYTYGGVSGNLLVTGGFSFTLPAGAIANGAVGIISSPDGL